MARACFCIFLKCTLRPTLGFYGISLHGVYSSWAESPIELNFLLRQMIVNHNQTYCPSLNNTAYKTTDHPPRGLVLQWNQKTQFWSYGSGLSSFTPNPTMLSKAILLWSKNTQKDSREKRGTNSYLYYNIVIANKQMQFVLKMQLAIHIMLVFIQINVDSFTLFLLYYCLWVATFHIGWWQHHCLHIQIAFSLDECHFPWRFPFLSSVTDDDLHLLPFLLKTLYMPYSSDFFK